MIAAIHLLTGDAILVVAALTAALVAFLCAGLTIRSRKQLRELRSAIDDLQPLESKLTDANKLIEALGSRLEEVERRPALPGAANGETAAVNLNRRGQVIHLYRKGDSPGQIASALGLSQGEVRLTLKLHDMVFEKRVGGEIGV